MADAFGGPMYCLMSARSRNAQSMADVMLDVVRIRTLLNFRIWSNCVRTALTTRRESLGSAPMGKDIELSDSSLLHLLLTWHGIPFKSNRFNFVDENADQTLLMLNYFADLFKQFHDQFATLRKPFWKQAVTVDFHQMYVIVPEGEDLIRNYSLSIFLDNDLRFIESNW